MEAFLAVARAAHFAATISLTGVFAFACLIAGPAARFRRLAWASLALALVSGAAWLVATAARMSGEPLVAVLTQGVVTVVLTGTRFGEDWLLRLGLAALIALCLVADRRPGGRAAGVLAWAALLFAGAMLASLAWAGHGAATPGAPGDLHLAGDILHLLGAGLWLGTLPPLALLLAEARRGGPGPARIAVRRYSRLAFGSVLVLLVGGAINTWFLAGTVPALVGTGYGRLLLAKIALFLAMLVLAAVNLLRLGPRLDPAAGGPAAATIAQLRRNALVETGIGLGVVAIVGLLGLLPPGLHTEPGWPFPFRIEWSALALPSALAAALLAVCAGLGAVIAVAVAAAGRYRRSGLAVAVAVGAAGLAWLPLRPALAPAYPTSFYAPAEPYAVASIAGGAKVYAANCAICHGAGGRGDGPAAAGLPIRPADLTEPHLFAHSPGDLFWWVGQGRGGVMPGFAKVLTPDRRWDVINFIRARAAGRLARQVGPTLTAQAAPAVPDFAFETPQGQQTLRRLLATGPVLLVLFAPPTPAARLDRLAAARPRLAAAGLRVVAADTGAPAAEPASLIGAVATDAAAVLRLFQAPGDGGETELLLDRNGDIRARWTGAAGLPDPETLIADAARAARFAVAAPSHAGHGG